MFYTKALRGGKAKPARRTTVALFRLFDIAFGAMLAWTWFGLGFDSVGDDDSLLQPGFFLMCSVCCVAAVVQNAVYRETLSLSVVYIM